MSPGPEAFSAATLEIAWVCTGRKRTDTRLSLAPISRAASLGCPPFGLARTAAWSRGERRRAGAVSRVGTTSSELTARRLAMDELPLPD